MTHGGGRFELASLGDLIELLADGWRIDTMHYADRWSGSAAPAALFDLSRAAGEARHLGIPEDGRHLSHRALVGILRESPHVWKHRSPDAVPPSAAAAGEEGWGEVPEPFPEALALGPATLRGVVAVGQVQSVDGLDIALTALERHAGGACLRYLCHAAGARARRRMRMLDAAAVDDGGRRYRVAGLDDHGEGNRLEGTLALAPGIPADVRRITVTIGTVDDAAEGGGAASGPWIFPIALAPCG